MGQVLLKQGDVIELKEGMRVYGEIPESFVITNRKLSNQLYKTDLTVGKVYTNDTKIDTESKQLAKKVVDVFSTLGSVLDLKVAKEFVDANIKAPKKRNFSIPTGEYVVIGAQMSGGGMDRFSYVADGHLVTCRRLKDGKFDPKGGMISFYQTGSFTAVISNIAAVRHMEPTYS